MKTFYQTICVTVMQLYNGNIPLEYDNFNTVLSIIQILAWLFLGKIEEWNNTIHIVWGLMLEWFIKNDTSKMVKGGSTWNRHGPTKHDRSCMYSEFYWFITLLLSIDTIFLYTIEEWSNTIQIVWGPILAWLIKKYTTKII